MTINLEQEIVETRLDAIKRECVYVLERQGRRWTVRIPLDDLQRHGPNNLARRMHLGNRLAQAMNGPPDPAPEGVI